MSTEPTDTAEIRAAIAAGIEAFLTANQPAQGGMAAGDLSNLAGIGRPLVEKLAGFVMLLRSWSAKMNLVSAESTEILVERHILDCAALWAILLGRGRLAAPLLDIGSGAGLPGIVLAILSPDRETYLCEPREKRCLFMAEVKRRLELNNIQILPSRVEEVSREGGFETIISRAVSAPQELISASRRLLSPSGCYALMVGPQSAAEGDELVEYKLADGRRRGVLFQG